MIDYNNIPANVDKQVFDGNPSWQTWRKPKGYTMADILLIGGGGNGGGGNGGAGGASACLLKMQIPFYFIPDTLFLLVGRNTESTFLSCYPNTTASSLIGIAPAGGSGGTGLSVGVGVPALVNTGTTNPRYLSLCNWLSIGGVNGGVGARVPVNGADSITMNSVSILNPGAGGGGRGTTTAVSGGAMIVSDVLPSFFKQPPQSIISGVSGVIGSPPGQGFQQFKPFVSYGGLGGAGNAPSPATGQPGTNGNIGSGGGGGGNAGGGGGGFGLAIITSY